MNAKAEVRWAMAVRALALVSTVLLVVTVLEAGAIRRLRAELQTLRTEREEVKTGLASPWAQQSADDVGQAIRWLDSFYVDSEQGFARPGGLCAGGKLDDQTIARYTVGAFLPARAAKRSVIDAIDAMKTAIRRTDAYRSVHPDLALPANERAR
jgi:hypothetical protein